MPFSIQKIDNFPMPLPEAKIKLFYRSMILCLLVSVYTACSNEQQYEAPQTAPTNDSTFVFKTIATASVSITEDRDQGKPMLSSIQISPRQVVIDPGDTIRLSVEAFGPERQRLDDIQFSWAVSGKNIGTINKTGSFLAGSIPGTFESGISITALQNSIDGIKYISKFIPVTIVGEYREPKLTSVSIIPNNPTILKQQIYRFQAVGFDQYGMVIPGVNFIWKLNQQSIGNLNQLGYLTIKTSDGFHDKAVSVTGIWEGSKVSSTTGVGVVSTQSASEYLAVHILPQRFFVNPGDRLRLRAVALNGLGELVTGTELRWDMQNKIAGTVGGSGDFVAGLSPGIYTEAIKVEAIVPGETGFLKAVDFASVVVRERIPMGELAAAYIEPSKLQIPPRSVFPLAVRAVDKYGNRVKNLDFNWEVLDDEVGSIDDLGKFKASGNPGTYHGAVRLTASQNVGDKSIIKTRMTDVIITGPLYSATIFPTEAVITPGKTIHFSLTGLDEYGVSLPGLVVKWSVSDKKIGSIDAFGNFTAGNFPGIYQNVIQAEVIQRFRK